MTDQLELPHIKLLHNIGDILQIFLKYEDMVTREAKIIDMEYRGIYDEIADLEHPRRTVYRGFEIIYTLEWSIPKENDIIYYTQKAIFTDLETLRSIPIIKKAEKQEKQKPKPINIYKRKVFILK